MGQIKSALELALEKANSVAPASQQLLKHQELKELGQKFCAKYLDGEDLDIEAYLDGFEDDDSFIVMKGMVVVALNNLVLPVSDSLERFNRLKQLLGFFNTSLLEILEETSSVFSHYITNKKELVVKLEEHFKDIIKQKEMQLAQKTGRPVKLGIDSIPEAYNAYQKELARFDIKYKEHIQHIKVQISTLFELND